MQKLFNTFFTLVLFLIVCSTSLSAQNIAGTVFDADLNETLIGASIIVKGTTNGTVTDFDGAFELNPKSEFPVTLVVSYVGYEEKEVVVPEATKDLRVELGSGAITVQEVVVKGQKISEKQKAAPLTVESLGLKAIEQASSDNFYDELGKMKGVDLTAASLGFKVINTRGFNSTSPVRSLQIIDGVDNQAPGLNFSLGNFLGASELDVIKVDLIVGASSAYYGPNAFNGVISMETKNPFYQKGLAASIKAGERNLLEAAVRYADVVNNKDGLPFMAYKINAFALRADDWEAENYGPVFDTDTGEGNPGGFDAVNIYGDEYLSNLDLTGVNPWEKESLIGQVHRTGYREIDLVDYDTRNYKASGALHFRTKPSAEDESPELILSSNFGSGTTVYQGDNRFSLRNILFFQNRIEFRKRDKFFLRAYQTKDNAGDSYDPYFTALRLQRAAKSNADYGKDYINYWRSNISPRISALEYPELQIEIGSDGVPFAVFDNEAAEAWRANPAYQDSLVIWHDEARISANQPGSGASVDYFEPGTERFQTQFDSITTRLSNFEQQGTRFFDESSLYHVHGEYVFNPTFVDEIRVGSNARLYTPRSNGTIFSDTSGVKLSNFEVGVYGGFKKKFADDKLTASATLRLDKNSNFDLLASPAASLVYKPSAGNYLRMSFSSAIRNPTLADQYLFFNVGRAILAGNLDGVQDLIDIDSFDEYRQSLDVNLLETFDIAPIRPEQVRTFEVGYRTTLFNKLYVDAGYYYSFYNNFLGFNIGIEADFNSAGLPDRLQVFRYAANSINTVTTQGFTIGLNYYFANYFQVSGNYSWNRLNSDIDDPIIPAFNTPEHKFNFGFSGRDMVINLGATQIENIGFNINYKWIEGFLFEGSPQFTGLIPTYDLVDAQINYKATRINTTFKLGASNVLNNKQFQTYGGPRIGRLAYISAVYNFKKK
ncbi:MAG: TonB-dependent receptor [Saprospiraceae bacterium]